MNQAAEFLDSRVEPDHAARLAQISAIADIGEFRSGETDAAKIHELVSLARELCADSRAELPEVYSPSWLRPGTELLAAVADEAENILAARGYERNGKLNATTGPQAGRLASRLENAEWATGSRLHPLAGRTARAGSYLKYAEHQKLPLHIDNREFGELTVLVCVRYVPPTIGEASATVVASPAGLSRFRLRPGQFLAFSGATNPHGRTVLASGESITLLSLGF